MPPRGRLAACRVVSHRGERSGGALENTYAAFDPLRGSGVWGLEFDVRWTRDGVPVVFHDADLQRLFGEPARLADLDAAGLRRRHPQIPLLADFVQRYAGEFHLMCEVKAEPWPDAARQGRRLAEALAPALARKACHVLSLAPRMFALLPDIPAAATMGVSRVNVGAISAEALAAGRGGFSGQYATITAARIAAHHAAGQLVGCGFPASRAVLHREAGRGIDCVFTNRALQVERWRREALG